MNKTEKQKRYIAKKTKHERKRAAERKLMRTISPEQWAKHKIAIEKRLEKQRVSL